MILVDASQPGSQPSVGEESIFNLVLSILQPGSRSQWVLEGQRKVLGDEHPDAIATNTALAQTVAAFNFPLVSFSGPCQISHTTEPGLK